MGSTCTVNGVTYDQVSSAAGRKCLACRIPAKDPKLIRYHFGKTIGNLLTDGGLIGRKIVAMVRYVDTSESAAEALFLSDRAAAQGASFSVVYSGETVQRCRLEPNGFRKLTDPQGSPGKVFFDAIIEMYSDE